MQAYKMIIAKHENGKKVTEICCGPMTQEQALAERDDFNLKAVKQDPLDYAYVEVMPDHEIAMINEARNFIQGLDKAFNPNVGDSERHFDRSKN